MRAILFDLDGTLLDLDLDAFLRRYFSALEDASEPLAASTDSPGSFMKALHAGVGAMMTPHPGRTNRDVFFERLRNDTGVDLAHHWDVYERFYREVFPSLGEGSGPAIGAHHAVTRSFEIGLRVAIATNPIFPAEAVAHRLAWAGLAGLPYQIVTTYEHMTACKPHATYFRETAALMDVDPTDCLMVGDDRALDMPAADVGMRTFYVGSDPDAVCDYRGDLDALADLLPRIV